MRNFCLLYLFYLLCLSAHGQTAEQVIEKHIVFLGGAKKLTSMKTLITTGEYDYGGVAFPFTTYAKAPQHYKFIVPFEGKFYAQTYDGKSGWKIDAFKNETQPTLLTGEAARSMANEADVEFESPFIGYQRKGHQLILEGKEMVHDSDCYKIKLIRKNRATETYYFHTATYALVQKYALSKNEEMKGGWITTTYSDYRSVEGMEFAFSMVSKLNDQTILIVKVSEIKINAPIRAQEFKP